VGQRRVVITGLGAITPLGASVETYWDGLISGKSGIRTLTRFDHSIQDVHIGGECLDFEPSAFVDVRSAKRMDRFTLFGYAAAQMAHKSSGLEAGQFDPTRAGVMLGSGIGGLREIEEQHLRLLDKGPSKVSAFTIPKLMANASSGHISSC